MPPITTPRSEGTGGGAGATTLLELLDDSGADGYDNRYPIYNAAGAVVGIMSGYANTVRLWYGNRDDPDVGVDAPLLELADTYSWLSNKAAAAWLLLTDEGGAWLWGNNTGGADSAVIRVGADASGGAGVDIRATDGGDDWVRVNAAGVQLNGDAVTAPTPAGGDNSLKVATTAFVQAVKAELLGGVGPAFDTLIELYNQMQADESAVTALTTTVAGKQPVDAELTALAGLVSAANKLPYFTGSGAAALTDLTAFIRGLLAAADAPTARATLGVPSLSSLLPSSDSYIDSQAATTNYDSNATLTVGDDWASASFCRRALLTFDISTLAGKTLQSCVLRLFTSAYGGDIGIHPLQARKVRRAYSPAQVTWNVFSTGNNWTTAGAKSTASDIEAELYGAGMPSRAMLVGQEMLLDLRTMVQAALDAAEATLRIIVGPEETDNQNSVSFHSLESATAAYRPRLIAVG